jgi:signal transduction histidine kinase
MSDSDTGQRAAVARRLTQPWPLRIYIIGLAVVFLAAAAANLIYQHNSAVNQARQTAEADARFAAALSARDLGTSTAQLQQVVTGTAGTLSAHKPLPSGTACRLAFDVSSPFPAGHLDIVRPDGTITCSSWKPGSALRYHGATWLSTALTRPVTSGPVIDARTGQQALVVAAPAPGGRGVVAAFVALRPVGPDLAARLGGPLHLQFLISTAGQSRVLARSADPARWVGAPLASAGIPRLSARSEQANLGGTPSLYSEATVGGRGWQVVAAIPTAQALAAANGTSDRQLLITLAGLVLFLAALWVIYRRITRPISRLSAGVRAATSGAAPRDLDIRGPAEVAALAEDFTSLIKAAAERHALEERLRRAERAENQERELRLLADRDRIARGLHDTIIRRVFATGLSLASISQSITEREPRRRLEDSIGELDIVAQQIRDVVFASPAGPSGSVQDQVRAVAAGSAAGLGFQPVVGFTGPVDRLPAYLADQMLATVRESLAVVASQAQAHTAQISVVAGDDLMLVIQHDGAAPDPAGQHDATLPGPAGQHDGATPGQAGQAGQPGQAGGATLDAARARAERLGGGFTVRPGDDGGTRLEWHIPLPQAARAKAI